MRRLLCVEAPRTSDTLCPTQRACTQGIPVQGSTYTQYHIAVDIFFRVWQSRGPQPPYLSLWKQNKDSVVTQFTIIFSPRSPGTSSLSLSPKIILRFSAPVTVSGAPVLKLETGVIDREAVWVDTTLITPGANDDDEAVAVAVQVENDDFLLLFEYVVVTGDSAGDLDYWADEEASKAWFLFVGVLVASVPLPGHSSSSGGVSSFLSIRRRSNHRRHHYINTPNFLAIPDV